jgi:hypothetical protein
VGPLADPIRMAAGEGDLPGAKLGLQRLNHVRITVILIKK